MTPLTRLRAYLADRRLLDEDGTPSAMCSGSPYSDLTNLLEMLPAVFAEVEEATASLAAMTAERDRVATHLAATLSDLAAARGALANIRGVSDRLRQGIHDGTGVDGGLAFDELVGEVEACTEPLTASGSEGEK